MSEFPGREEFGELNDVFNEVMQLPDDILTGEVVESLVGMIDGAITPAIKEKSINATIQNFSDNNYSKQFVANIVKTNRDNIYDYINDLQPSSAKRQLLNGIAEVMCEIFDEVLKRYHGANFQLNVALKDNGQVPTYAHPTDAAADLYAAEDMVLPPHSLANTVHTQLYIELPEGWTALILPRSSIGKKTGLRLSNSVGVIDSTYRGEIGVMYDNISDSEYTIHAGDRIAQMLVIPTYSFATNVVAALNETERGEGGFGSTGV